MFKYLKRKYIEWKRKEAKRAFCWAYCDGTLNSKQLHHVAALIDSSYEQNL